MKLTDRKRQDILDAALLEFQRRGYLGTSMDRVAATAGVSKRTVYKHFDSKDALFIAVVGGMWATLKDLPVPPVDDSPIEAQLRRLADFELSLGESDENVRLVRVALAEFVRSPELARAAVEAAGGDVRLEQWFTQVMERGLLSGGDPAIVAGQFIALLKGFGFYPQLLMGAPRLTPEMRQRVIDDAISLLLARYS